MFKLPKDKTLANRQIKVNFDVFSRQSYRLQAAAISPSNLSKKNTRAPKSQYYSSSPMV